jgi:hypothetical protein
VTERMWAWGLGGGHGLEGGGTELAQRVEGSPRELARDGERRASVAEAAGLQGEVIGWSGLLGRQAASAAS